MIEEKELFGSMRFIIKEESHHMDGEASTCFHEMCEARQQLICYSCLSRSLKNPLKPTSVLKGRTFAINLVTGFRLLLLLFCLIVVDQRAKYQIN